jgi:hypothetical protein
MNSGVYRLSDVEIVEPRVTGPVFAAMISGLAAGITAAATPILAFCVIASVASTTSAGAFGAALFVPMLVLLTGSALALFPIGPLWVAIAWILVRHDTRSVRTYAAAGAAASTGMPFLLPALMFVIGTAENAGSVVGWLVLFAWFATSGALGGAFAGLRIVRILRENGAPAD